MLQHKYINIIMPAELCLTCLLETNFIPLYFQYKNVCTYNAASNHLLSIVGIKFEQKLQEVKALTPTNIY